MTIKHLHSHRPQALSSDFAQAFSPNRPSARTFEGTEIGAGDVQSVKMVALEFDAFNLAPVLKQFGLLINA